MSKKKINHTTTRRSPITRFESEHADPEQQLLKDVIVKGRRAAGLPDLPNTNIPSTPFKIDFEHPNNHIVAAESGGGMSFLPRRTRVVSKGRRAAGLPDLSNTNIPSTPFKIDFEHPYNRVAGGFFFPSPLPHTTWHSDDTKADIRVIDIGPAYKKLINIISDLKQSAADTEINPFKNIVDKDLDSADALEGKGSRITKECLPTDFISTLPKPGSPAAVDAIKATVKKYRADLPAAAVGEKRPTLGQAYHQVAQAMGFKCWDALLAVARKQEDRTPLSQGDDRVSLIGRKGQIVGMDLFKGSNNELNEHGWIAAKSGAGGGRFVFQHADVIDFYNKHFGNIKALDAIEISVILNLLRILDRFGDCPSVIFPVTDYYSKEPERKMASEYYDRLYQVVLRVHALNVAEGLLNKSIDGVDAVGFGAAAMIAGLAHDLGKIPEYRDMHPAAVDHTQIGVAVLESIPGFSQLSDRAIILKAISSHHNVLPPSGLCRLLKIADNEARIKELENSVLTNAK